MTWRAAVAGALAAATALSVAELLASLLPGVPSPLDAVGQVLVGVLPGSALTWAIETFGTTNRLVLAVSSVLVACAVGALVGRSALTGMATATAVFGAAALFALLCVLAQPGSVFPTALLALLGAALAGLLVLRRAAVAIMASDGDRVVEAPVGTSTNPVGTPTNPDVDRRAFLRVALGAGVVVAGAGVVGRGLGRDGAGPVLSADLELPPARRPLPAVAAGQDLARTLDGVSPVLTPTDRFFRIDTAIGIPMISLANWSLTVRGMVRREVVLSFEELLELPLVEVDATIACVSNEVGGDLIGTARWLGVPLTAVLDLAGVEVGAEQLLGRSVDGFTAGFPLEVLADGRPAIVAVGMNGEPLPPKHGAPARLVVPGLFGYVSATKWLGEIELTVWDGVDGFWIPRGWSKLGPVKTGSRIDRPRGTTPAGPTTVAGVAWAPTRGVDRVEVAVDGGDWSEATLVEPLADTTWVQWHVDLDLAPGGHVVSVRAVDGTGALQPEGPRPPAPDGSEGWHTVSITAS